MPELPEVEVVRRGLARWVRGRRITAVEVADQRSIRRHAPGADDFVSRLVGARVLDVARRGKFLWMPLGPAGLAADPAAGLAAGPPAGLACRPVLGADDGVPAVALMAHLGMSGQLLMQDADRGAEKHLKVRIAFEPDASAP
ncbi:MAG TPA: DNA-formamidopyrimidine glycosylase family protein, partial [Micrococcaceae bacterium]